MLIPAIYLISAKPFIPLLYIRDLNKTTMKGLIKMLGSKLLLIGVFSFAAIVANAQVYVSKGVHKYANKKAYESAQQEQTQLRSAETPSIVVSKGVHKIGSSSSESEGKGNVISQGYPYWTLAKGVNHHHQRPEQNTEYISRNK
jgi:hypothetical protein